MLSSSRASSPSVKQATIQKEERFIQPQSQVEASRSSQQQVKTQSRLHQSSLNKTKTWLNQESETQLQDADIGIAEDLYSSTLNLFRDVLKLRAYPSDRRKKLEPALANLFLWGRDFRNGGLTRILLRAEVLQGVVISLLKKIGTSLCAGKQPPNLRLGFQLRGLDLESLPNEIRGIENASLKERRQELDIALDRTTLFCSNHLTLERTLEPHEESSEARALETKLDEEDIQSAEASTDCFADHDSGASDDVASIMSDTSSDTEDVLETIQFAVEDLMDLLPSIERSSARSDVPVDNVEPQTVTFSVSQAALPFVKKIADRFPDASIPFVERLGESNWQRFMKLRAISDEATYGPSGAPKSTFVPQSLFHDSGIGSSYAQSSASHTSFISSLADEEGTQNRIPETPAAVTEGKPFNCEICGITQHDIRNRIAWKMHVFEDLKPYICSFSSCKGRLWQFATRNQWADHEFSKHRIQKTWSCPECSFTTSTSTLMEEHLGQVHAESIKASQVPLVVVAAMTTQSAPMDDQRCPLCLLHPGKSRRHFVKHVAKHLETIALDVLPPPLEEDSDREEALSHESGTDVSGTGESSKCAKAKIARRRTTDSFKTQASQAKDNEPAVYQGKYGVYNGLEWDTLRGFLENKFPRYRFEKVQVRPSECYGDCGIYGQADW